MIIRFHNRDWAITILPPPLLYLVEATVSQFDKHDHPLSYVIVTPTHLSSTLHLHHTTSFPILFTKHFCRRELRPVMVLTAARSRWSVSLYRCPRSCLLAWLSARRWPLADPRTQSAPHVHYTSDNCFGLTLIKLYFFSTRSFPSPRSAWLWSEDCSRSEGTPPSRRRASTLCSHLTFALPVVSAGSDFWPVWGLQGLVEESQTCCPMSWEISKSGWSKPVAKEC